jgi:hypothetical protein
MGPNVAGALYRVPNKRRQRTSSNLVSSYFTNYDLVHTDDPKLPRCYQWDCGLRSTHQRMRVASRHALWCARSGYNSGRATDAQQRHRHDRFTPISDAARFVVLGVS